MYKWIMFVLFIGASVLGVGALFNQVGTHAKENAPDKSGVKKLSFTVSNYKFDQTEYHVAKGEKMKVSMILKEGVHAVEATDLGIKLTPEQTSQDITFDKPGTYTIHCVLPCGPGHPDMKATIVVT